MSPRFIVALIAGLVTLPLAGQDDACSVGVPPSIHWAAQIDALFTPPAEPLVATDDGVSGETQETPGLEVLVARVGPDGKIVFACVDSAAAAKRFLENRGGKASADAPAVK